MFKKSFTISRLEYLPLGIRRIFFKSHKSISIKDSKDLTKDIFYLKSIGLIEITNTPNFPLVGMYRYINLFFWVFKSLPSLSPCLSFACRRETRYDVLNKNFVVQLLHVRNLAFSPTAEVTTLQERARDFRATQSDAILPPSPPLSFPLPSRLQPLRIKTAASYHSLIGRDAPHARLYNSH